MSDLMTLSLQLVTATLVASQSSSVTNLVVIASVWRVCPDHAVMSAPVVSQEPSLTAIAATSVFHSGMIL